MQKSVWDFKIEPRGLEVIQTKRFGRTWDNVWVLEYQATKTVIRFYVRHKLNAVILYDVALTTKDSRTLNIFLGNEDYELYVTY